MIISTKHRPHTNQLLMLSKISSTQQLINNQPLLLEKPPLSFQIKLAKRTLIYSMLEQVSLKVIFYSTSEYSKPRLFKYTGLRRKLLYPFEGNLLKIKSLN